MSTEKQTLFFDRLEVKYLVDRTTRTALYQDLTAFMQPDAHAGPEGYYVRSLYFDTPDYMAYHEKISGAAVRHKLRLRAYGGTQAFRDDPSRTRGVRLEVKSRYLSYIHKITVDISREDYDQIAHALRHRTLPPKHLLRDEGLSKEFFRLQRQYNMEPKVLVQYRRQAFERWEISPVAGRSRVRVNFDDELVAARNLDLLGPLAVGRRLLQYGHAVFEIKIDKLMPYWLHQLIAKYNLRNQAFSKYCYAVRSEGCYSAVGRENGVY